jgi:hypothetical protein
MAPADCGDAAEALLKKAKTSAALPPVESRLLEAAAARRRVEFPAARRDRLVQL